MEDRGNQSSLFLMGGNLTDGAQVGSAALNLYYGLTAAIWSIGARKCGNCENFKTECRGGNNPPAAWRGCLTLW